MSKKRTAYVDTERCDGSPFCPAKRSCPQNAMLQGNGSDGFMTKLGLGGGGTVRVDEEKCTGCGVCVNYCPMGAVSMRDAVNTTA